MLESGASFGQALIAFYRLKRPPVTLVAAEEVQRVSMTRRHVAPIVRHHYANDPDPEKVQAALALWRRALAQKMARRREVPGLGTLDPEEK